MHRGEKSIAEFKRNVELRLYKRSVRELFVVEDLLPEGYTVYEIPAIVHDKNDFLLGYHDRENKRIYVAEETIRASRNNPDHASLIRELVWHEVHENPDNQQDHYQLILRQQKHPEFKNHYEGKGYEESAFSIDGQIIEGLKDPLTGKIAKGELGKGFA